MAMIAAIALLAIFGRLAAEDSGHSLGLGVWGFWKTWQSGPALYDANEFRQVSPYDRRAKLKVASTGASNN